MYKQRNAYENLTRMNFVGAGQYDIPTIWNDEINPESLLVLIMQKLVKTRKVLVFISFLMTTNSQGYGTDPMTT